MPFDIRGEQFVNPTILMYHSVSEHEPTDPYGVSKSAFRDQISWLIDSGYQFVSLSTLVHALRNGISERLKKAVALTFDDGYQDFLIHAVPVLVRHQLPATVFIVTDRMGQTALWSTYNKRAPLMSEAEVRYVKSQGVSLGSHTLTHPYLTALSDEELKRQLMSSLAALTDLGETFCSFAYPFGEYTEREAAAVKAAGYKCAVTVSGVIDPANADLFLLGRLGVDHTMDFRSFKRAFPCPRPWNDWITGRARSLAHAVQRSVWSGKSDSRASGRTHTGTKR